MRRPARSRQERLIDGRLLARAYLFLGPLESVAPRAAFLFVLVGGGWVYGQMPAADDPLYLQATTACLSVIVVMQVVNVFLCRSEQASGFSSGLFSNRLIWAGIVTELVLILLIVYTAPGNRLFGTAPMAGSIWLLAVPFALGMIALEEGRKWLARRFAERTRKETEETGLGRANISRGQPRSASETTPWRPA
jgi:magnesium-transporting ATPase (P-type)